MRNLTLAVVIFLGMVATAIGAEPAATQPATRPTATTGPSTTQALAAAKDRPATTRPSTQATTQVVPTTGPSPAGALAVAKDRPPATQATPATGPAPALDLAAAKYGAPTKQPSTQATAATEPAPAVTLAATNSSPPATQPATRAASTTGPSPAVVLRAANDKLTAALAAAETAAAGDPQYQARAQSAAAAEARLNDLRAKLPRGDPGLVEASRACLAAKTECKRIIESDPSVQAARIEVASAAYAAKARAAVATSQPAAATSKPAMATGDAGLPVRPGRPVPTSGVPRDIPLAKPVVQVVFAANQKDPQDKATLYQRLDDDYLALLGAEPDPAPLREAERLLARTNQNSHWGDFLQAIALIRQHRSRAAIPLLMKYIVEHASFGSSNTSIPQYVDAISILAGEKVDIPAPEGPDRQKATEQAIIKVYVQWWLPNRATLTTDLGSMPDERVKFVVDDLMRHADEEELNSRPHAHGRDEFQSTETAFDGLTTSRRERSGRQEWWKEELRGRMTPILLEDAGYVAKPAPADDPTAGAMHVAFGAIPLLAALRREGQAPMLDTVADDPKQNNATRLTCILALHDAGDDIDAKAVASILDTDTRLECRVLALMTLGLCDKNIAIPRLVTALDDANSDIRLAAIHGLRGLAPKAALPKLCKVVRDGQPPELVLPAIMLLGHIGGADAAAALVDYMEKSLKDGGAERSELFRALDSFSTITDMRWIEAGAHQPAYYAEQAQKAVNWWKARQR